MISSSVTYHSENSAKYIRCLFLCRHCSLQPGLLTRPWAHEAKAEAEARKSEAEVEATESEAEAEASHHEAEAKAEATN